MQDLCHATRCVRTSSNPTGAILIKVFPHLNFWGCIFSCVFIIFCVLFVCFCFDFCCFFVMYFLVVLLLIFFFFFFFLLMSFFIFSLNFNRNRHNIITMKFQDTSCPPLFHVPATRCPVFWRKELKGIFRQLFTSFFFNVRFKLANFPFSIAQISSIELSSAC